MQSLGMSRRKRDLCLEGLRSLNPNSIPTLLMNIFLFKSPTKNGEKCDRRLRWSLIPCL